MIRHTVDTIARIAVITLLQIDQVDNNKEERYLLIAVYSSLFVFYYFTRIITLAWAPYTWIG